MAVRAYHEVVTALEAYEGNEHSSAAQQYLNLIAGDTVVVPGGGPTIPASSALRYSTKAERRKAVRDALEENPPRKITEAGQARDELSVTPAATAALILTDLLAFPDEYGQEAQQYKAKLGNTTATMYDLYGNAVTVRAADMLRYNTKGFSTTLPTIAVTGTAIDGGVTEAQIVTGGETLIFTLTNGTWATNVLALLAALDDITVPIRGSGSGATAWNDLIAATLDWTTDAVRTSDTVLTLTLPALGSYAIAADETVTFYAPPGAVLYSAGGAVLAPNGAAVPTIGDSYIPSLAFTPASISITAS